MNVITYTAGGVAGTARRLASGVDGIRELLAQMRRNIRAAAQQAPIRALAERIVAGVGGKDRVSEARAVQAWVRSNIRYTRDPIGAELLKVPALLILPGHRQDDCDGHAQLVASLLASIGHPVRLVAVGFEAGRFAHVFAETLVSGRWLSVETTEPVGIGWQPARVVIRMLADVSSDAEPEIGFLKKIKKAVKKVGKVALKVAPVAAFAVAPGAAAALATVNQSKAQATQARTDLVNAQANAAAQAAAAQAAAVAPRSQPIAEFVGRYKLPLAVGGVGLAALLLTRRRAVA
ncbi:MAG: hypothetical protein C0434_12845 [Xanthomonadaceae bacterium]|nr:hypothetical protein [Xanthomonadaceae bacterium]